MACSECNRVFDYANGFVDCKDCGIFICGKCALVDSKKLKHELTHSYMDWRFELELLLKKASLHVQYEMMVLEQIKLVENDQDKQKLRDYPKRDVITLETETEEGLRKFLTYQDTINHFIKEIKETLAVIWNTNSYDQLMDCKNDLHEKKEKLFDCLDVEMIEREIKNENPFVRLQKNINAAKLNVVRINEKDEHTVKQILNAVHSDLDSEHMETSLAVIGRMKAGKSEFINTFRGKKPKEERAAKVGIIECTDKLTPYEFVKGDHKVVLWDCPGFGGSSMPQKEYIDILKSLNCDVYLYLYSGAITENDQVIISDVKKELKREIFVARTHADEDFRKQFYNETSDDYEDVDAEFRNEWKEKITEMCRRNHQEEVKKNQFLKTVHWDQKVHYISCRLKWVHKFDYQELFEDICHRLPRIKRENILMVANTHVVHLLDAKKKLLSKRINHISDSAAWESLIPFKTCNAYQKILDAEVQVYLSVFDLSEESVKLCRVNDCIKKMWKEMDHLHLDVFDFKPAKDEFNFKAIGLTAAMYLPFGLGGLIAWPVNKSTSVKYLTEQLENIYRLSKASFDSAFESLEHEYIHTEKINHRTQ